MAPAAPDKLEVDVVQRERESIGQAICDAAIETVIIVCIGLRLAHGSALADQSMDGYAFARPVYVRNRSKTGTGQTQIR
jgi:ABC-type transporter lipoprotein component MlaA